MNKNLEDKENISELYDKYYGDTLKTRRGYKTCNSCKKKVGCRNKICPLCQFVFIKGESYKEAVPLTEEEQQEKNYVNNIRMFGRIVYYPRGVCPIDPVLTKEGVYDWCYSLLYKGQEEHLIFFPSVMSYWLRSYQDINSKKYKKYNRWISEWSEKLLKNNNKGEDYIECETSEEFNESK